jgi:hypothetical protein
VKTESIVGIKGSGGFVGCGFAVSPRHILTCAHVVNAALGTPINDREKWPESTIEVVFPYLPDAKPLRARVVYWKPQRFEQIPSTKIDIEEDIAGLELLDVEPRALPIEMRSASSDQAFRAFGYPKKTSQGGLAEGKLQGDLPCGWFQMDATCSEGLWAEPGYSGTAVWDKQDKTVLYGMVVARKRDDSSKIAYMIPVQGLENAIAHLRLLEILPCSQNLEDDLGKVYLSIYRQCCPSGWGVGRPIPKSLSEILADLDEMQSSVIKITGNQVERKLEFVARLLVTPRLILPESKKEALRLWGMQQFSDFFSLIDFVREAALVTIITPVVVDPCLMIEISPNNPPYITRAFFIPDTQTYKSTDLATWQEIFCWDVEGNQEISKELEPFEQDDSPEVIERKLKQRLAGYIMSCRTKYTNEGSFRVELILPQLLMSKSIECWKLEVGGYIGSIVLGSEYPVVIRSYDRTTDAYQKQVGEVWRNRWARLEANKIQQAVGRLAAIDAKAEIPQFRAAYQNPLTVGIKISDEVSVASQENCIKGFLASGTAVAVWLRRSPPALSSSANLEGSNLNPVLNKLNEFLQCLLSSMPNQALECRSQAIMASIEPDEANFMIGHHLSLLWENPNLLPPSSPKQASEYPKQASE